MRGSLVTLTAIVLAAAAVPFDDFESYDDDGGDDDNQASSRRAARVTPRYRKSDQSSHSGLCSSSKEGGDIQN